MVTRGRSPLLRIRLHLHGFSVERECCLLVLNLVSSTPPCMPARAAYPSSVSEVREVREKRECCLYRENRFYI